MSHYYWEGINRAGKKISGNERISRALLEKKLNAQDITILKIRLLIKNPNPSISKKIISAFTFELWVLLNSGITLQEALKILMQSHENKSIAWIAEKMAFKISQGISLSESFRSLPEYFDSVYCNMIAVGEESGTLLNILEELVQMQNQLREIQEKFFKALSYPAFILFSTILITSGLLIFVMPKFQSIFEQSKIALPLPTQILLTLSAYVRSYALISALLLSLIPISLFYCWKKIPQLTVWIEKGLFKIPMLGHFIHKTQGSRFAQILSTSLHAGVPLSKALEICAPTSAFHSYQSSIREAQIHIQKGERFSLALKNMPFLSKSMQSLIAIGESTGELDAMLAKIADLEQKALQKSIDVLSKWLEPVMMMLIGFIVGGMIVAMYLPVFQMNSGI